MSLTIPELMEKMPIAFVSEKAQGVDAVILFNFTGPEAGEWTAVIKDGKCTIEHGSPSNPPKLTLTVDSSDYLKLVVGELDGMRAFMQGKLKLAGDMSLAMKLMGMFKLT
jgi:putative sterol carrier protein